MMLLKDVLPLLERLAPLQAAASWDNVGLLLGGPQQTVQRVMACIDLTQAVLEEAQAARIDLLLAYHPPLFKPLRQLRYDSVLGQAARCGMAIYSPHTAWDAAPGGANCVLADALGLQACRPLQPSVPTPTQAKLIVFVPHADGERVAEALFAAGAGKQGNYSRCSFRQHGQGRFQADIGSQPARGSVGQLSCVEEMRLEVLVPLAARDAVLHALRATHPYEEIAFDWLPRDPSVQLPGSPPSLAGMGRLGHLPQPTPLATLAQQLKQKLQLSQLLQVSHQAAHTVQHVACVAGAGASLLETAQQAGADLFVTGELRHHDALRAQQLGMAVLCTLHSHSERLSLPALLQQLQHLAPQLTCCCSTQDRDPLQFV